jgi:hypothetical protein
MRQYASEATAKLGEIAATRKDLMRTRGAIGNRLFGEEWQGNPDTSALRPSQAIIWEGLNEAFDASGKELKKVLTKEHELAPWLAPLKGMNGVQVAILLSRIRDPWRFPGQPCSDGHIWLPQLEVGSICPAVTYDEDRKEGSCTGTIRPARPETGVRSVWHYCGLHVMENGSAAYHRKGTRSDWDPVARTALLMPDVGIIAQIIKQRTPKYRDIYDAKKDSVKATRPFFDTMALAKASGLPNAVFPGKVDTIAKYVAGKAFLGDLLMAWKELVPLA